MPAVHVHILHTVLNLLLIVGGHGNCNRTDGSAWWFMSISRRASVSLFLRDGRTRTVRSVVQEIEMSIHFSIICPALIDVDMYKPAPHRRRFGKLESPDYCPGR